MSKEIVEDIAAGATPSVFPPPDDVLLELQSAASTSFPPESCECEGQGMSVASVVDFAPARRAWDAVSAVLSALQPIFAIELRVEPKRPCAWPLGFR